MDLLDRMTNRFGTLRNVARVLGLPEQRVYKWKARGIPEKYNEKCERILRQGVPQ